MSAPLATLTSVAALVLALFARGGPTAVAWLVVPVVVDPINGPTSRAFAHVGEKVLERVPALAHRDPATAVVVVGDVAGISAPIKHVFPRPVSGRITQAVPGVRGSYFGPRLRGELLPPHVALLSPLCFGNRSSMRWRFRLPATHGGKFRQHLGWLGFSLRPRHERNLTTGES